MQKFSKGEGGGGGGGGGGGVSAESPITKWYKWAWVNRQGEGDMPRKLYVQNAITNAILRDYEYIIRMTKVGGGGGGTCPR